MSFKDILVHLDGGERDLGRIAVALTVARRFDARLTGLFARLDRHGPSVVARRPSDALAQAAEAAERGFAVATADAGISCRFWQLGHGEESHVLTELVICARFADLVVLGQRQEGDLLPADFIEQVMLQSGRPCLLLPSVGTYPLSERPSWWRGMAAARPPGRSTTPCRSSRGLRPWKS